MPISFFIMVAIMTLLVGGLVVFHYRSLRAAEKLSVAGTILSMALQYVVFGLLLFLFVNCAGCFNKVLIPY